MKKPYVSAIRAKATAKLFAIAFFVLALLIPGPARVPVAQAYRTENARWADYDLPVVVNLDRITRSLGSISPDQVRAEIRKAMSTWKAVGTPFRFVEGQGANGHERVEIDIGTPAQYPKLEVASTGFMDERLRCGAPATNPLRGACIVINELEPFATGCAAVGSDLQTTVLHELGHALGLAHSHPLNPEAVMWGLLYFNEGRIPCRRELTPDDRDRLISLYGPITPIPPTTTPGLISPTHGITITTAQIDTTTQFELDWEDSPNAVSYYVQVSESADFWPPAFMANPTQSFVNFTADPSTGTTYYWRVKAKGTGSNSPWSEIRRFAILLLPFQLYEQSEFPILEPGEDADIHFTLQNIGSQTWEAGRYALVNVNGLPLGAPPQVALDVDVPSGQPVRWPFLITAPSVPGVYRTKWRFSYDGQLIGPLLWMDVIVVPGGGDDLAELIRSMIDEARRRGEEWFREQWEELRRQIIELIWAEIVRQIEEFLAELCGGSAATGALSLAILWLGRRRPRVGNMEH